MKVKAKILSNSDYGWFDFWGAIDSWVNRKGIEIAREPDLAEYESDEEREQGLRIIKGIWEMQRKTPHGKMFAYGEKFDEAETWLMEVLTRGFTIHGTGSINEPHVAGILEDGTHRYQDEIVEWVRRNFPSKSLSTATIERRLRSIRAKGGLETDGDGNYWSRIRKEITA